MRIIYSVMEHCICIDILKTEQSLPVFGNIHKHHVAILQSVQKISATENKKIVMSENTLGISCMVLLERVDFCQKCLLIDDMKQNHDNRKINLLVIEICMSRNIKKYDLK